MSKLKSNYPLIMTLGENLPSILPMMILNKREEILPIIVSVAKLHPDARHRTSLIQSMMSLIKKPDVRQRQLLVDSLSILAKHSGPTKTELEILPFLWDEVTHKASERRMLVCEVIASLVRFVSVSAQRVVSLEIIYFFPSLERERYGTNNSE
jgi:hypothetical protein